jgi:hypothetical protein
MVVLSIWEPMEVRWRQASLYEYSTWGLIDDVRISEDYETEIMDYTGYLSCLLRSSSIVAVHKKLSFCVSKYFRCLSKKNSVLVCGESIAISTFLKEI